MNVCVFCSSSTRLLPEYAEVGRELGTWIGAEGHTLVWGGCNVGLMDVVGRAARIAGARTVAVIPRFLVEQGLAFDSPDEILITPGMAERKDAMRQRAEAFVALPGGIGTWEEVFEVLALKKLGQLHRPIVIANVHGYFDPLLEQIQRSLDEGFSPPDVRQLFGVARTAAEISQHLNSSGPK